MGPGMVAVGDPVGLGVGPNFAQAVELLDQMDNCHEAPQNKVGH